MNQYYIDEWGREYGCQYVDERGRPVERNRIDYPYTYDPYVLWKTEEYDSKKDHGDYSDRLSQWDYEKYRKSAKQVNCGDYFNKLNGKTASKFLSIYFDRDVKCTMLMQGCNVSNGHPYWIFFHRDCE